MTVALRRVAGIAACLLLCSPARASTPIAAVEYRVAGTELRVSPPMLTVPKGVAGSVLVELVGAEEAPPGDAFVEGTLRGPSFPARIVIGRVNEALLLPPLPVVGDYQLDNIRLVRLESGDPVVLYEGLPSSVPVRVFDEVLVSRVTSRPLSLDEIREKGIAIDQENFRAIEFEVGFVLDGRTIPVLFPVVAPTFNQATEIIPAAELQELLAEAEQINQQIDLASVLPPDLETARLNIDIKGINFQVVDALERDLTLTIPPIPAIMVVPGNIGFLNQFFSVQIFTENASPIGSGLSAFNIQAELVLPPGPDFVPAVDYGNPGDDPLRFARVGPNKIIEPIQSVAQPGPDGEVGTGDDIGRLQPGQSGQGEFLVEGLQEGLHVMNLDLTADLDGLAAGTVKIMGKAAGSVLVRNPNFSMAFSHPRTTRAGEPYDAYVTILNTSATIANLVQVTLSEASISGGILESDSTVVLGSIAPGQTATAQFQIRAQRTGAITFSNLTTGDEGLVGRFRLRMGIDERGVTLSPDTLAMPSFVTNLPPALVNAANRVLGQALSVATAPQLPPEIEPITKEFVKRRVVELAEAGQRIQYGDTRVHVLADLLLDWQGGREFGAGFDQILRTTDAGREWRESLARELDLADASDAVSRLLNLLPHLAGRGEAWTLAALDDTSGTSGFGDDPSSGTTEQSARYENFDAVSGIWLIEPYQASRAFEWKLTNDVTSVRLTLGVVTTNGTAQQLEWTLNNLTDGTCLRFPVDDPGGLLSIDTNGNGTPESQIAATVTAVNELAPALISVQQDIAVKAGRPPKPCLPGGTLRIGNYGTVVAVLFSKPLQQDLVDDPSVYLLDNGNPAATVQIQPGGRVALINFREPVGPLVARTLAVSGIMDPRGNVLPVTMMPLQTLVPTTSGLAVNGRVARADGSPAADVPVTLTMHDETVSLFGCDSFKVRVSQTFTDPDGYFHFDFVLAGIPYSISATDITGLSGEALELILDAAAGDQFNRDKLQELAETEAARDTLLEAFAVGALPEAVALAEGLDRAVLRDAVDLGSPRAGTEVPVALRFRGRGTVEGQVVGDDGAAPISDAAVNLFPDPGSRERGRGVFSDANGRFAFFGVPLGVFSIQAETADGLNRIVSGTLDTPGGITNVVVVVTTNVVTRTDLAGRVTEADHLTGHAGASVFIGEIIGSELEHVVAVAVSDAAGYWTAEQIPANTYDVMAISLDGKRKGQRLDVFASAGVTNQVNIALQGLSVVIGRVQTPLGIPIENAIIAGGETLVRSDSNGNFTLTGVPTGRRTIAAGVERTPPGGPDKSTPPYSFPRIGSAKVEVLPGVDNFVLIEFEPRGSVVGQVLDVTGTTPVTNINVALPDSNGFRWVPVDDQGEFAFEGLELGRHLFSAPAPVAANTDVTKIQETLSDPDATQDEVQAAIGEAFAIFTGANDPFLTGEGENFNPVGWGFTETELTADGEVRNITIRFRGQSTISGRVLNDQGVPIGARVRLTGLGPAPNGEPTTILRGERNSDPALGTFIFEKQALFGDWQLQATSPFYPVVLTESGLTSDIQPDATNIVLRFPSVNDVNGRLAGTVFDPDGLPMGSNVNVGISFGTGFVIRTIGDGTFDTQIDLPALDSRGRRGKTYLVTADDPVSGAVGAATVIVLPGVTNTVDVHLLGRGALEVTVLQNDGTPANGANVDFEQAGYPMNQGSLTADSNGDVLFQNLFEGDYAVCAQFISGPTTLSGRMPAQVVREQTNSVVVILGPTGTIEGKFLLRDLVTPVGFAQVALGDLGFTTTDSNGFFQVVGVPVGTYRLVSQDPVTGVGATRITTLTFDGQTNYVNLVEQSRGEVLGTVIDSDGVEVVPGAPVTIRFSDRITPQRTVTSGPDGQFSFPGSPAGSFTLTARHPVTQLTGSIGGELPEDVSQLEVNISLEPLASLTVIALRPDGVTPATNVNILADGIGIPDTASADALDVDRVQFTGLRLGRYRVTVRSLTLAENNNAAETEITLETAGELVTNIVVLAGVGDVTGTVFENDGTTPADGATVDFDQRTILGDEERTVLVGVDGAFQFSNVAVGDYSLLARRGALGVAAESTIDADGESEIVDLILEDSGTVTGLVMRADGVTPVIGEDVILEFPGRSLPAFLTQSDGTGAIVFNGVPLGTFLVSIRPISFNGIAERAGELISNSETNDVGTLVMDEDDPFVVEVVPLDTSVDLPTVLNVELTFSEALATDMVTTAGIYLQSPNQFVDAGIEVLNDTNGVPRIVRLAPTFPLLSLTTYEVVVVAGDRLDPSGNVIGRGPEDLAGRPLVAPFVSAFTTADLTPPLMLSIFPGDGQVQIDPRAVMRLSFNEPISPTGAVVTLTGPGGVVAGLSSVGLNNLILAFAPDSPLDINSLYTLSVNCVTDSSGNQAAGQPFQSTFATLDTIPTEIAQLKLIDGQSPVAGGLVSVEAVLEASDPGSLVNYFKDDVQVATAFEEPYIGKILMPTNGSTTIRAFPVDPFGNPGTNVTLVLNVVSNQSPTLDLVRGDPLAGPLINGQEFMLDVSAIDDLQVTNVHVTTTGSFAFSTNYTDGALRMLTLTVPDDYVPGTPFQVQAQATDQLGATSPVASVPYDVVDGIAPDVEILSPAAGILLNPALPLDLDIRSSDNSGDYELEVELSGGLVATQTVMVSVTPFEDTTNSVSFSLAGAATNGTAITATVRATDGSTNMSTVVRLFDLPDLQSPRFVSVTPDSNSVAQSLWSFVRIQFDEPIDPTSAVNVVTSTNSAGTPTGFTTQLENFNQRIRVNLDTPLEPGVTYTNTLLPGVVDTSGNPLVLDTNNTPIPVEGVAFPFTTAEIFGVTPTNGAPIVPGQLFDVSVDYEQGLGAQSFQFAFDTNNPVVVGVFGNDSNVVGQVRLATNAVTADMEILARRSGETSYTLPPASFTIRSRAGDDDNDGLSNGYEADNDLDPFVDDADLDADSDGVSNLAEFQIGTDPQVADTDGDGLDDGAEVALGCADPLDDDSDDDGLLDGVDPDPCGLNEGLTVFAPTNLFLLEGVPTNVLIQVSSEEASIHLLEFSPTNPVPLFATLQDVVATNTTTNGVISGTLQLVPGFEDAGNYVVSLTAKADNGGIANLDIPVTVQDNPALTTTRWVDPISGNWNDPARWDNGLPAVSNAPVIDVDGTYTVTMNVSPTVPGFRLGANSGSQTLTIPSGTLTLTGSATVHSNGVVQFNNGVINSNGSILVRGTLNWVRGTMQDPARTLIATGAVLTMSGSQDKKLDRRRILENRGLVVWTQGDIDLNSSLVGGAGQIENTAEGTWQVNGSGLELTKFGNEGAGELQQLFSNAGTFINTTNAGTTSVRVPFNNTGSVELRAGELKLFSDGTNTASFALDAGTTLSLPSDYTFEAGTSIEGNGLLLIDGGTLDLRQNLAVGNLEMNSFARLEGTNSLTITDTFDWSRGTMAEAGRTIIATGAVATISGSQDKKLDSRRILENRGLVVWTQGDIDLNSSLFGGAGQIENTAEGTWLVNGSGLELTKFGNEGAGELQQLFSNAGTFINTTNAGTTSVRVPFNNTGSVELRAGELKLFCDGTNTASYALDAGTTLSLLGDYTFEAETSIEGEGSLLIDGGTLDLRQNLAVGNFEMSSFARLEGTNSLTITDTFDWSKGTMAEAGRTIIATGAVATISGSSAKFMDAGRILENRGHVIWTQGDINLNPNGANGGCGQIHNSAGGIWEYQAAGNLDLIASGVGDRNIIPPEFRNAGTFLFTGGGRLTMEVALINSGEINIQAGELWLQTDTHAFNAGTTFGGTGLLEFRSPIALTTDVSFNMLQVNFTTGASIAGTVTIFNVPGGTNTYSQTMTVPGAMTIAGRLALDSASRTVTILGTLTLEAGGVIDNPGTLLVGAFVDNGGTIIGNSPQVGGGGGGGQTPMATGLVIEEPPQGEVAGGSATKTMVLRWSGPAGNVCSVQWSTDLGHWTTIPADISEPSPGSYIGRLSTTTYAHRFFRVKFAD